MKTNEKNPIIAERVGAVTTYAEQLEEWLKGNPIHKGTKENGSCCPDFSCCRPEMLADLDVRESFCKASKQGEDTMGFLMMFLGKMLEAEDTDEKVHIAGDEPIQPN